MQTDQLQQYLLSVMTLCCKNSYFSFQQLTTTVNIFSRTFKSRWLLQESVHNNSDTCLCLDQVTLMLMDQGPSRKHLGDAFKPDPNSSSFRRPAAEMNIASGCPLFVSQSVLETGSYIKDDTIFIKVRVCMLFTCFMTVCVCALVGLISVM